MSFEELKTKAQATRVWIEALDFSDDKLRELRANYVNSLILEVGYLDNPYYTPQVDRISHQLNVTMGYLNFLGKFSAATYAKFVEALPGDSPLLEETMYITHSRDEYKLLLQKEVLSRYALVAGLSNISHLEVLDYSEALQDVYDLPLNLGKKLELLEALFNFYGLSGIGSESLPKLYKEAGRFVYYKRTAAQPFFPKRLLTNLDLFPVVDDNSLQHFDEDLLHELQRLEKLPGARALVQSFDYKMHMHERLETLRGILD